MALAHESGDDRAAYILGDMDMGVSKNRGGPPKSSILIEFSLINHPFWGTPILGNTNMEAIYTPTQFSDLAI